MGAGAQAAVSTSAMGHGVLPPVSGVDAPAAAGASRSSTRVFQASQPEQRPVHFGSAAPHSVQR